MSIPILLAMRLAWLLATNLGEGSHACKSALFVSVHVHVLANTCVAPLGRLGLVTKQCFASILQTVGHELAHHKRAKCISIQYLLSVNLKNVTRSQRHPNNTKPSTTSPQSSNH
jgi:hypothetical protein